MSRLTADSTRGCIAASSAAADGSSDHRYPSPVQESRANDTARACSASMSERSSRAIAPPSAFAFKTRNKVSRNLIARAHTWAAARGDAAPARRRRAAWPPVTASAAGFVLYEARRFDAAIIQFKEALELEPASALDVGTGSAVLVRTANGHQLLIDAGPDTDRLTQAMGRTLPPTARTIDVWVIAGGRRVNIGAAPAVDTGEHRSRFELQDVPQLAANNFDNLVIGQAEHRLIAGAAQEAP